ncbi:Beta-lactamase/transpeptidase-like protein [Metarhizium album ARSEF 1941]|uniref:Beta-lactamase/transpeptidase-like protein n=1 Tax=Metarhizium album (strain ARSEF 1941) TaxID=1081103 RepID=A0A0B2X614_METAS|nr:Beta-lactamase/transpeptidase-like protein [Metarhizium album ARSEF 1941]KHO01203.1 Beta-lactamase/transpeptidase-like protein [Metarhizium album ARSEF 1941]
MLVSRVRGAVSLALAALASGAAATATATAGTTRTKANREVLKHGSPESVGMLPGPLEDMVANLTGFTERRNWGGRSYNQTVPIEPGGTTIVARHGTIVSHFAFGKRNVWAGVDGAEGTPLPAREQEAATTDTIYDMASLTKVFTAAAALRCVDGGRLSLNESVARYLPEFAAGGKGGVTVLQLLTHTSGLAADPVPGLFDPRYPTYESRVRAIAAQGLQHSPGTRYLYSDVNFMVLGLALQRVTGRRLDELVGDVTTRLGMDRTFFNRGNVEGPRLEHYADMAAQEFQLAVQGDVAGEPRRPQPVRGSVHDENAWALGGVAGHAGLFSTAMDTARFCQMLLNNGTYGGRRILSRASVDLFFTDFLGGLGGHHHAVGFELNQFYTAGPMANMLAASHTGFTGTSMVVDRASGTLFVHLSNRVHPSRRWSSNNGVREALGAWVARALGRDV